MAEGFTNSSNLSHSQINVGDEFIDLSCTKCRKKNLTRQAKKYCMVCKEYFCDSCVDTHNSFKELSEHPLVNPYEQIPSSNQSGRKLHAMPTERCKYHPLEVVNMYCSRDDSVGCPVCFTLYHRSCAKKHVHYIPEYIQSYSPDQTVDQINTDLTKAIQDNKQLKTHHDTLDANLDQSKATCKQEIQNYRGEINYIIDKIEAATLADLDARYKTMKRKSEIKNQDRQDLHDEMVRYKSEMECDQTNNSQKFVLAKLSHSMIKQGKDMQSELPVPKDEAELTFTKNIDIIAFILSFFTLGLVGPVNQRLYNVSDKSEFNVREADDKTCGTCSSCILDNSNLLLADESNQKLKLVDSKTYTIISSLKLNGKPSSVCRANRREVAVSLGDTIQIISTNDDTLVSTRSYPMNHNCRCVAVVGDKMFVGDFKDVHVYTLTGKHVKTICEDRSGNEIFSLIYGMAVSEDGKMVYITDWDKGVVSLNTDGYVVWRYTGSDLRSPCGVCTDGDGNVIVCGEWSHNVVQIGPHRHYMGEVVTHGDLKFPQSVSYDRIHRKLIVGSTDNNNITVFTLQ